MAKVIKIQGNCPYCNEKDSVKFTDFYYSNNIKPYAKDIPMCVKCDNDYIEVRKINNRRYKIVGEY